MPAPKLRKLPAVSLAMLISSATFVCAQEAFVAPPPPTTLWRFMGIPQGVQRVRDVSTNRRGNHPGLERKPPVLPLAAPENLASSTPAIKAAAEIKQAEDLKKQKIKAIKYLATIGCGCYDKDGKVTAALLAATDDCTPDVRLAAIEAIEAAASGECCKKCGSTSCCNEKTTKRLSEIAYEKDSSGCPLEPVAEIRTAAKRALCKCCPGRGPTGMIEEDVAEEEKDPADASATEEPTVPKVPGEPKAEDASPSGESKGAEASKDEEAGEGAKDAETLPDGKSGKPDGGLIDADRTKVSNQVELSLTQLFQGRHSAPLANAEHEVQIIGGMRVKPVTIDTVSFETAEEGSAKVEKSSLPLPVIIDLPEVLDTPVSNDTKVINDTPVINGSPTAKVEPVLTRLPAVQARVSAEIASVDRKTGEIVLLTVTPGRIVSGASAIVYHTYLLSGEQQVAQLITTEGGSHLIKARVADVSTLSRIQIGDRVVCH